MAGIDDWITPGAPARAPRAPQQAADGGPNDWITPEPEVDLPTAILRGVTNPLGVAPMIGGAIQGGIDWAGGQTGLKPGGTFQGGYDDFVAKADALDAASAHQHPVGYYGGKIASGVAIGNELPSLFTLGQSAPIAAKIAAGAADAGVQGAGAGAITNFGETRGTLGEKLAAGGEGAITGLVTGAAIGAPLSAVGAGLAARAAARAAQPAATDVAAAAQRGNIRMPAYAASNSLAAQQIGHVVGNLPIVGPRVVGAARTALGDAEVEAARIGAAYGGGVSHDAETAGRTARAALTKYSTETSDNVVDAAYSKVDNLINPSVTSPLNATQAAYRTINLRRAAAALGETGKFLKEALSRPGGLTYDGIKQLRTSVGQAIKEPQTVGASVNMANDDLRNLYSALTDDLQSAAYSAGGKPAQVAWQKANGLAKTIADRREQLQRILGATNDAGVYDRIMHAAGSTASQTDTKLLATARATMGKDAWGAIASAASNRLGRTKGVGDFSLDKFVTQYADLTPVGRFALFGEDPALMGALNDLDIVGRRFKSLNAFKNHSNTAQNLGGIIGLATFGSHMLANPWLTAATAISAPILARVVSRPATVRAMTNWAKVYNIAVSKPSAAGLKSLQFASRQFASEIGSNFGLGADQIGQMSQGLLGPVGPVPVAAQVPDAADQGGDDPGAVPSSLPGEQDDGEED
jgi:hypothetical protein